MDVLEIAESRAELLHRLCNWGSYSTFDGSHDPRAFTGKLDAEELWDVRLARRTAQVAASRARAAKREFEAVLKEVELEVAVQLARILCEPAGLVEEEEEEREREKEIDGPVCGICLEEMEMEKRRDGVVAVECGHEFHECCIVE